MSFTLADLGIIIGITGSTVGTAFMFLWRAHSKASEKALDGLMRQSEKIAENGRQIEANRAALQAMRDTFLTSIETMKAVFETAVRDAARQSAFAAGTLSEEVRNTVAHLREIISINAEAAKQTDIRLTHLTERTTTAIEHINLRLGRLERNGNGGKT